MKSKRGLIGFLLFQMSISLNANADSSSLLSMAKQGDTDAQVILGYQYLTGSPDTSPSIERAKYWLRKAAEQGDSDAQGVLGTLYYTEKQYSLATPLLTQACEQHNEPACVILKKIPTQP